MLKIILLLDKIIFQIKNLGRYEDCFIEQTITTITTAAAIAVVVIVVPDHADIIPVLHAFRLANLLTQLKMENQTSIGCQQFIPEASMCCRPTM